MISHSYDNKPNQYFQLQRAEMLDFIPASARSLLEVGCGRGEFVALLKSQRTIHATGVEPYAQAAVIARQHFDVLLEGTIDESLNSLHGQHFDCIVFNDVLEHLVDPWTALRSAKTFLAEGGCVVASIPNMRYWPVLQKLFMRGAWAYVDSGVLDRTHLRFFTKSSIRDMFHDSGLHVDRLEGINDMALPWKISLLSKLTGGRFDDTRHQQFACVAHAA